MSSSMTSMTISIRLCGLPNHGLPYHRLANRLELIERAVSERIGAC